MTSLSLAITADLHWGTRHDAGRAATLDLVRHLTEEPPALLILAGDIGAGEDFARCLELFDPIDCRKCLVPGNHDIWVTSWDPRGDSWTAYNEVLPRWSRDHGFHYLDHGPLMLPDSNLAVVGSMNWYDYSWGMDHLPSLAADWQERLSQKRFTRGRHNDANFVRWSFDDAGFTNHCVTQFEQHLNAIPDGTPVLAVTHHPPFPSLNWPRTGPPTLDGMLWAAFSGNASMEQLLLRHEDRITHAFCGHTHKARTGSHGRIAGHNIGGDYHFKRLLRFDRPSGTVRAITFGEES